MRPIVRITGRFFGRPEVAMDTKRFLSHFEGRINRARYWLAVLMILGSMISALLLLAAICLIFGIATGPLTINLVGVSASFQLDDSDKAAPFPQFVTILMTFVFGWFYVAVSIRRLHDRNKSGWWMIPFVGAAGLYGQFGDRLAGSWAALVVGLAVFIAFIWGMVEMDFLKGTNGPNRFGADPLAPTDPIDTRPRWDQQSELEFVPHSAGPSAGPHVMRGHD
jgi:uncharacterized membrane protein YhaH (DUF805 family)